MYEKPLLAPLDPSAAQAICCTIRSDSFYIQTPLCPFPGCEGIDPCEVSVGGVTISS